jgi:CDP-diglyceride synthetase
MIKRILFFTIAIVVLATSVLFIQKWYISSQAESLTYSLTAIYIFHFIAYLIIVVSVELLSKKLPNQVGFFYLASVFIKIGFFVLIFKDAIFAENPMNFLERISIIIPFFMFLIFEAIYSGRLMNAQ